MSQTTNGRHLAPPPGRGPARRSGRGRSIALVSLALVVVLIGGFGAYLLVNRSSGAANCGSGTLTLQVLADPDQASLLQQAARDYAGTKPMVNDRCVAVNVRSLDSPEATAALGTGWTDPSAGPRPDVWVPAASTWASELELQLQQARGSDILPAERPSVATSPLVIAMPKPMAQALGWPKRQLGWADMSTALRNPAGWAAFGHPEWGPFKLGKTDPKLSEAGLGALLGAGLAVAGQDGRPPTPAELAKKAPELGSMILEVSRSPGDETDTTSTLLANLQRADETGKALSYISAVPLTEKSVWDYNEGRPIDDPALGTERPKPKVPLAAFYPKEGTLQADYPWLVLHAPWVDDAKRAAASDFLLYLKSPSVQARFQAAGFRSARGQPGGEISPDAGLLPDQPKRLMAAPPAPLLGATLKGWDQTKRIANLLAVYDVSGSMAEKVPGTSLTKMDLAKQAAAASLRLFTTESDVGTWEFSTHLDGTHDYRETVPIAAVGGRDPGGVSHLQRLQEHLARMAPTHGDTALYDTALAAYEYVKKNYAPDRLNLVVLITDGRNDDPDGGISLQELLQKLRAGQSDQKKVRILAFAYGQDADVSALTQISKATGGAVFTSPNPADIERVFVTALANF